MECWGGGVQDSEDSLGLRKSVMLEVPVCPLEVDVIDKQSPLVHVKLADILAVQHHTSQGNLKKRNWQ